MSSGDRGVKIFAITALSAAFLAGFVCGYQVKTWRLRYLKFKKDYLSRKLNDAENRLNEASGIAMKEAR